MDNQFEQGKFIGVSAREIVALERKQQLLIQQANELKEKANQSRVLLFDLIASLQESTPHELPGRFTVNGLLIDITGGKDFLEIQKVPELINHLEGDPTS